MIAQGSPCSFCGHTYIFPCNGERYDCANAVFVRQHGRSDGKKTIKGKAVEVSVVKEVKPKRKRVRL